MCTLCNVHTVQFAHCAKCTIVQSAQLRRALCSIADAKNRWTWVILRLIARLDCKFGWLGNFDVKFTRHKCLMISILKTEICSNQKVQENKLPLKLNWSMNWYSQIVKLISLIFKFSWHKWILSFMEALRGANCTFKELYSPKIQLGIVSDKSCMGSKWDPLWLQWILDNWLTTNKNSQMLGCSYCYIKIGSKLRTNIIGSFCKEGKRSRTPCLFI